MLASPSSTDPVFVSGLTYLYLQCGMGENETTSTISVVSASHPPWNSTGEFTFSQAVGPGCRELNYCSGQGV